jgi:thiol-disulfide isomerase/thioredoxin
VLTLFLAGIRKREVVITGHISEESGDKMLVYTIPISGTSCFRFNDTVKIDDMGNFELKFPITKPTFITFWTSNTYKQAKLLIEPDNSYHLVFDGKNEVQISGADERGQMLLSALPSPEWIELEGGALLKDTSLVSIHEKIEKLKQDDLRKFTELLEKKEISSPFYKLIETDRNCYYASLEARILLIKIYRLIRKKNDADLLRIDGDPFKNLEELYTQYPPNDESLVISLFWNEYAERYATEYKLFSKKDFDIKDISELRDNGTIRTFMMNESKKYLTGKALEFFQARYICYVATAADNEKELIPVFEQFKKDFPHSEYTKYLTPHIDKIVEYYKIIEQPLSEEINFLNSDEEINTLADAIKLLKGKATYIDVWATWCGPCREEFKHNAALKKILAEKDIQQLYISIDNDERAEQWKNGIKYYNLTGAHIRANKSLGTDLAKRFDKENGTIISIPWYILVDKNGNILDEHAKSPSQLVAGEEFISGDKF